MRIEFVQGGECFGDPFGHLRLGAKVAEHAIRQAAGVGVVVDDQDAHACEPRVRVLRRRTSTRERAKRPRSVGLCDFADARGRNTRNVAPCPLPALSAWIVPPCNSTICLAIARPRPRPPSLRVVEASPWLKRSKMVGSKSAAIP